MKRNKKIAIGCVTIPITLMFASLIFLVILMLVLSYGCDKLTNAGTWEDDAGNWERAFNQPVPDGIEVINSHFWKSPHWTYEASYCFKLKVSGQLLEQMKKGLKQRSSNVVEYGYFSETPKWFPVDGTMAKEIWCDNSQPEGFNNLIMIIGTDGYIYWADWQV